MATDSTDSLYERKPPKGLMEVLRLPMVLCALMLVAVNGALLLAKPFAQVDPDSLPAAHTWVWWAAKEFQEMKKPPSVVLLGSSLVMHPVSRMDAQYLGKNIDYVKHHRSQYMEDCINKQLAVPDSGVYNFALPGGMVSDDYMVARALLNGQRKPAVMVLGLSVRDFIDNGVRCAGATPAFKYLKRYTTIDDLVDVAMPQIHQRSDYWLGNGIYLWGKKLDLQVMLSEKAKTTLTPVYAKIFAPSTLTAADTERNQPSNLRAEVEEGMMMIANDIPYSWEDNSAEYKRRYRSPNEKGFETQLWFFKKLCELGNERGIKIVIVNMPLTPQNHGLIPSGSYDKYVATLQSTAKTYGCDYLDLDGPSPKKFDLKDYYDTAHMNASGGHKLIDELVGFFGQRQPVITALQTVRKERSLASQGHSY